MWLSANKLAFFCNNRPPCFIKHFNRHAKKELTAVEGAAAKLWHTELQWEIMDKCLQLHGGAGYMNEYPIARAWRGARVTRIFGGTNEIMKELIGRSL